jgi:hypothetical protein
LFPENALKITYGYSKDHQPDLKQFMISRLCVEHNIPILGETHDGNSSDKTLNNKLLSRISKNLAQNGLGEGAFTYVADSAEERTPSSVRPMPKPNVPLCAPYPQLCMHWNPESKRSSTMHEAGQEKTAAARLPNAPGKSLPM